MSEFKCTYLSEGSTLSMGGGGFNVVLSRKGGSDGSECSEG